MYFDNIANPAQTPAPIHHPHPSRSIARQKHTPNPSNAATSGPSGSTHPPVVTPNTGAMFSVTAAQSPARAPNSSRPSTNINQVETPNSAMNGSRTTTAASLPTSRATPADNHHANGG